MGWVPSMKQTRDPGQPATLRLCDVSVGRLAGISFEVPAGAVATLGGPSGSGKSRLLRAIADVEPHGGDIYWRGANQSECLPPEWRQRVMMVPAESHWWFDRVGDHFPEGVEVDYRAVGLADATEPTANLDPDNVIHIEQWLRAIAIEQSIAIVWVAHDPAQAERVADCQLKIRDGRVLAS